VQVIVYVFVNVPSVTMTLSVSVLFVQVTVDPVKVTSFNLVTTVAEALSVVYESVSVAFVEFVVYATVSLLNVGLKFNEPRANEARFGVKKPPLYSNPCTQQL